MEASCPLASEAVGQMAGKKVIAVKDWTCGMSDEIGRVVLTINPTEGEPILVLMTILQAAKMAQELRSPKRVSLLSPR